MTSTALEPGLPVESSPPEFANRKLILAVDVPRAS